MSQQKLIFKKVTLFYVKHFNHSILSQQIYTKYGLRDLTEKDSTYPHTECSLAGKTDMKQGLTTVSVIK